jgi:hypothetical protein
MATRSMSANRPAAKSRPGETSILGVLTPPERAVVLEQLLATNRDLVAEAEQAAHRLLASVDADEVADEVSDALTCIELDDLAARAGRVRGGYVHETDAAWQLVEEAIEPFVADVRRRAGIGLLDATGSVAAGILAGLYAVRDPEGGSVLAYAGPDAPGELADEVLREADRLGLEIPKARLSGGGRNGPIWPERPARGG